MFGRLINEESVVAIRNTFDCVHVVASLHPDAGGPSRTVVHLTDALARQEGVGVTLVTQGLDGEPTVASNTRAVDRHFCIGKTRTSVATGLPVRSGLRSLCRLKSPSIIHSHGLWLPANHWASRAAVGLNIPLVIHPRGMLEPWALQHKRFKKILAMSLFQREDLYAAKMLVVTSENEYESVRGLGLKQAVAIIPNGVNEVEFDVSHVAPKALNQGRKVLFLSRVHEKKGLLNLVKAWGRIRAEGWILQIAGPNEGGHLDMVMAEARSQGISEYVHYLGPVDGSRKSEVYHDADLFVLPTFSENFGVVVAEALAHGLPVITTRGAPWRDLLSYQCGWWIDIGVDPLVSALRDAMALDDQTRRDMGERGRSYVRRYNWDVIASQTADAYRWLLSQGPMPACVRLK